MNGITDISIFSFLLHQVTVDITGNDIIPPGRTTDLEANFEETSLRITFTSPGDDLDSETPVTKYVIKYATGNLTSDNFDSVGTEITEQNLAQGSTLTPVNGGLSKDILLK